MNDPRHYSHKEKLLGKLESLATARTRNLGSKLLLFFFFRPISPRTTYFHVFVNGIVNNTFKMDFALTWEDHLNFLSSF
uniref:Uncharacterized protein n=1 Tax=Vitis vinifera TaxID=29760 RepID=F6HVY3_VITVI